MNLTESLRKLQAGESLNIVALGDSLTYGWMVAKGYIDFLQEMLLQKYPESRFTIANKGIPGDTARGGFQRVKEHVIDLIPDLVFIQFGLNDAYTGYAPEDFESNITAIMRSIRNETKAEMLLVTSSTLGNEHEDVIVEKYYNRLKKIAKHENVCIALVHEYWKQKIAEGVDHHTLVQPDLVHPTVEGYRLMAEAIMKVLC
jgi:acyl-CoA thioesterase-1